MNIVEEWGMDVYQNRNRKLIKAPTRVVYLRLDIEQVNVAWLIIDNVDDTIHRNPSN